MKKLIWVAGTVVFLVATAIPASAAIERVNAAENVTRYDSTDSCNVFVDDFDDMEVNVYCFGDGRTWFKVRVPDVTDEITSVNARSRGDCSGEAITVRKRGDVATVKVTNTGDFDCYYSTITVRHRG